MKHKILTFLAILVAIFLGTSLTRSIFSYKDKIIFYNELKAENEKERELNKKLKSEVSKGSDYFYIERQIREKLNLLQEGETSLIIPPITPSPTPKPEVVLRPYQMWSQLFFKK